MASLTLSVNGAQPNQTLTLTHGPTYIPVQIIQCNPQKALVLFTHQKSLVHNLLKVNKVPLRHIRIFFIGTQPHSTKSFVTFQPLFSYMLNLFSSFSFPRTLLRPTNIHSASMLKTLPDQVRLQNLWDRSSPKIRSTSPGSPDNPR